MKTWLTRLLLGTVLPFSLLAEELELPLKAGDHINITIGGVPAVDVDQIRGGYAISDQGTINLLHIKVVKAAGLKPSALQAAIERAYVAGGIYTNPTVSVTYDDANAPRQVHVISGCKQNGPVIYTPGMSILEAISGAHGFSPYATPSKTTILRDGKTINLDLSTPSPAVDVHLLPGDQIIIRE
jgi:protein involved in polysaccharide export with SLBB domain